jgi:hypothetical protein
MVHLPTHRSTPLSIKVVTKEDIAGWKQALETAAIKKRLDREQQDKAIQERIKNEQMQNQQREERDRLAKQAEAEALQRQQQAEADALQRQQQATADCDRLGANPTDARKTAVGVSFDALKLQADEAFHACNLAVQYFPNELRYQYQLGRASQFKDKKRAFEIFAFLTRAKYPAAFDNLGGMYLDRRNISVAIQTFRIGASLGDVDSMVSLADLVDKGYFGQQDPVATKWALLNKAAELGHSGAQRAVATERARSEKAALDQASQQEAARNAALLFGTIIQNIGRR